MITLGMMGEQRNLTATFLAHAPVRVAVPHNADELEAVLRCAWEAGRDPWPQVVLPAEIFVRHLSQRLPKENPGAALPSLIDQLALGDLYLACACLHEVPASIEMLERHYLAKLPAMLGYLKLSSLVLDDVCQSVRIHLLMGGSGTEPQLAEYTGRGALLSWIRVVAVRMALKQGGAIRERSDEGLLAALKELPAPEPDMELDLIKRRYRREFHQAVCEAFATLPREQRHRLRLHFVDQLSTTQIGALFRVNQSTVSRWLKSARKAVYEETKRRLQERLGLSTREFTSLLNTIQSQFDLSLNQLFTAEG